MEKAYDFKSNRMRRITMDLRFLGKVLQGALIGLGAVLPGISGGVLSVVFGVYRPIMELLSDPVHKWRTHLPRLLPYMIGSAAGFLGVANLLSYVLETYPEQSVCVFVGLIGGMLPSLWREAGGQDRRKQDRLRSDVCGNDFFAVFVADFQDCSGAGTRSVSVLWICPCSVGDRSGDEFFYTTDALRAVYTVRRGDRSSSTGGVDSRNDRLRGDFCVSGQAGKPPA